ncbi:hypothetical protein EJ07DRAFT_164745 [Lizonia empirigonia]|nr:hypothetical protein EJ07DRAFT_164745 [Lizonia empirigonia]
MRVLIAALTAFLPCAVLGQLTDSDGYTGYKLDIREDGDPLAVLYETENTTPNVSALVSEPDVLLNALVYVGEIYVGVDNLTAKINFDAQVLSLLSFNAGVDLSIDKVSLLIQNVTAKVYLEARLTNLVAMVCKRSEDLMQFEIKNSILYSANDFSGNTHTRRVLAQNGGIVEQKLNNYGSISNERVVGNYLKNMRFNGFNKSVTFKGEEIREEEYIYEPFKGLFSIIGVFKNKSNGQVVGTQLLAEAKGGGSATIGNEQN